MTKRTKVLKRYGHKGQFVKYPPNWQRRMVHTGKRRFDTNCDLLVGICACGERHTHDEHWVRDCLQTEGYCIETHEDWLKRIRSERTQKALKAQTA